MTSAGRVGWKAVRVLGAGPSSDATPQAGPERLAALYRFQSVGRSPGNAFFITADGKRDVELDHPDQVDWAGFPVIAALEAVTYDELRRLRLLLTESGEWERTQSALQASASRPPTPPHGLALGADLRRGAIPSDL